MIFFSSFIINYLIQKVQKNKIKPKFLDVILIRSAFKAGHRFTGRSNNKSTN